MSFRDLLARLFHHRPTPPPPAPPTPPTPVPADDAPPLHLTAAFAALNALRAEYGRPPFRWDDRLYRAGCEMCEHNAQTYATGRRTDAHWDFLARFPRNGWPATDADGSPRPGPPDARLKTINYSEMGIHGSTAGGPQYPPDQDGWRHPRQDPLDWMDENRVFFREMATHDPSEPHFVDFLAGYTHAAIGAVNDKRGGFYCIEYGYLP